MNNSTSNRFLNTAFVQEISPKLSDGFGCSGINGIIKKFFTLTH